MTSGRFVRRRLTPLLVVALSGAMALGTLPATAQPHRPSPGNAQMGWRQQALEQQRLGADADAKARAFNPGGVLGIDVSSYQKTVNWRSWAAKGRSFAYIKATEGTSYRNPYFTAQYAGAAKAGLIRGAYHFASPSGKSGKAQADYFVKHGGWWTLKGKNTLPGVLDIEYNPYGSICYGLSKKKMVSWINDFVVEYKKRTTRDAVIYTNLDWWSRCTGNTSRFSKTNPLWAARWGAKSAGKLPGNWPRATFWQYTSSPIDQSQFSSTYARLVVLATRAS